MTDVQDARLPSKILGDRATRDILYALDTLGGVTMDTIITIKDLRGDIVAYAIRRKSAAGYWVSELEIV